MLLNLFSIFDPATSLEYSMNWISLVLNFMYFPYLYWFIPSRWNMVFFLIIKKLVQEFKMLLINKKNSMNILILLSIFFYIMISNLMCMFPYIFSGTSHLVFSLSLSLILWMTMMLFGWMLNMNHMFCHLVPQGTPVILMSFMVIIETISNFIRPGTLAVRLSANMIAGHLLMTLISSTGSSLSFYLLIMMILLQSILIVLELSVAVIQAYVFSVLSTLYSAESS